MSGGRKIDDHSFWAGAKPSGSVLPMGSKMKSESDDGHGGSLSEYEDTTEKIRSQQEMSVKKAKAHAHKPGTRY